MKDKQPHNGPGPSPYYFESHVTILPVTGALLETFHSVAADHRFHVATFTEDSAGPDAMICTGRSKNEEDLQTRMLQVVHALRRMGLTVTRYKMESTLLDSRIDDSMSPLTHKRYGVKCTFQPPPQVVWMNDGDQERETTCVPERVEDPDHRRRCEQRGSGAGAGEPGQGPACTVFGISQDQGGFPLDALPAMQAEVQGFDTIENHALGGDEERLALVKRE